MHAVAVDHSQLAAQSHHQFTANIWVCTSSANSPEHTPRTHMSMLYVCPVYTPHPIYQHVFIVLIKQDMSTVLCTCFKTLLCVGVCALQSPYGIRVPICGIQLNAAYVCVFRDTATKMHGGQLIFMLRQIIQGAKWERFLC
jgi:hypothetical protein